MSGEEIMVRYARVANEADLPLLAVFPESPFIRSTDVDALRAEVGDLLRAMYGTDDFTVTVVEVELTALPLAQPSRAMAKNAILHGGPNDGLLVWHAIPHGLLMSTTEGLDVWRYTQEVEQHPSHGELAVYQHLVRYPRR